MKKTWIAASALLFTAGLWLAGPAFAAPGDVGSLPAPGNMSCTPDGDSFMLDWDDVEGADKYSVEITCTMDDGLVVTTHEFDVNTADREDEGLATDSDLDVPFAQLEELALSDLSGFTCTAKVKAMNPGPERGRQNHLFSEEVNCGDIP